MGGCGRATVRLVASATNELPPRYLAAHHAPIQSLNRNNSKGQSGGTGKGSGFGGKVGETRRQRNFNQKYGGSISAAGDPSKKSESITSNSKVDQARGQGFSCSAAAASVGVPAFSHKRRHSLPFSAAVLNVTLTLTNHHHGCTPHQLDQHVKAQQKQPYEADSLQAASNYTVRTGLHSPSLSLSTHTHARRQPFLSQPPSPLRPPLFSI